MGGPLKWHGGKQYLAERIVALMPPRCKNPNAPEPDDPGWLHYVEPYFGGGAVLLANDPEGISEVANDLNGDLVNFWRCLANLDLFANFQRIVQTVPFSEEHFRETERFLEDKAHEKYVGRAVAFFVHCRQSLAGRMDSFAPLSKSRTRRGMNEQASAWLNAVEGLPAVHARLKRVVILNHDALDVIRQQDGPRTLFYLDPPYVHRTRGPGREYGENEMTDEQHVKLLNTLEKIKGRFLLSGYRNTLYEPFEEQLRWKRYDFDLPNNAAGGDEKRRMTESVWCNF